MHDRPDPTIPIRIEFNSSFNAVLDANAIEAFKRRVVSDLASLLSKLGLVGQAEIEIRCLSSNSSADVQVQVYDELLPYPHHLAESLRPAVMLIRSSNLLQGTESTRQVGSSEVPFNAYPANVKRPDTIYDLDILVEYLAQLVLEIIRERPGCLAQPTQVAASLRDEELSTLEGKVPLEEFSCVLQSLLDLGLSVADKSLMLQMISAKMTLGHSVEDVVEIIFARLHSDQVEIHIHPEYLRLIFQGELDRETGSIYAEEIDKISQDLFHQVEAALLHKSGVRLPDLVWVPSPDVPEGIIMVKINDRLGPPTRGLQSGEILINASMDRLKLLNVSGWETIHPANGRECTVVAETFAKIVEDAGLDIAARGPAEFLAFSVFGEVSRQAYRLFSIEEIEYQLAQLGRSFPELVQAAILHFSIGGITHVLRGLVREGISIRDLRTILESLLQYDTICVDPSKLVVFDHRLPLSEEVPSWRGRSGQNYIQFVRNGLNH